MDIPTLDSTEAGRQLQQRLSDERTLTALTKLLDRVETIERSLARMEEAMTQLPGMMSMVADSVDEGIQQAHRAGVDVEERSKVMLQLLERLSSPETSGVLMKALDRSQEMGEALDMMHQAPGLMAMAADSADEWIKRLADSGVDIAGLIHTSDHALQKAATVFGSRGFAELLDSGLLDENSIRWMTTVGESLAAASERQHPSVGLFGAMGAMGDPSVQKAMGFLFGFLRELGRNLSKLEPNQLPPR